MRVFFKIFLACGGHICACGALGSRVDDKHISHYSTVGKVWFHGAHGVTGATDVGRRRRKIIFSMAG
jgi:hypothetical protein